MTKIYSIHFIPFTISSKKKVLKFLPHISLNSSEGTGSLISSEKIT
jgi:hypothetical protein